MHLKVLTSACQSLSQAVHLAGSPNRLGIWPWSWCAWLATASCKVAFAKTPLFCILGCPLVQGCRDEAPALTLVPASNPLVLMLLLLLHRAS